jgi:hypothetical protein
MKKPPKQSKKAAVGKSSRRFYSIHPWQCRHNANNSEIMAYVEASGKWETVISIHPTSCASAETMATFIANLVNENQSNRDILIEAMNALESVLEDGGLNYTNEQDADAVVSRIKKRIG